MIPSANEMYPHDILKATKNTFQDKIHLSDLEPESRNKGDGIFCLQEMRSTSYGGDGLPAGGQTRYAVIARKRLLSLV